ncbi:MAG: hypothetical protein GX552_00670 [Chloroflexi bacterium]|jgi:hypothetical protein|nr:hypothetical protein [Chloroflexota bacterium]
MSIIPELAAAVNSRSDGQQLVQELYQLFSAVANDGIEDVPCVGYLGRRLVWGDGRKCGIMLVCEHQADLLPGLRWT